MKRKPKTQRSTTPRAHENRKIRQEALREQLAAQKLVEQIDKDIDGSLNRLRKYVNGLRKKNPLEAARIEHLIIKTQMEGRFRKLDKVLPTLKSQEGTLDLNLHDPAQTLEEAHQRARDARIRREQEREQAGEREVPQDVGAHDRRKWRH